MADKPIRCIDPVVKYCQGCRFGWIKYPAWVETAEDLSWCAIESGCTLGFEHDEPTEEELAEFKKWVYKVYGREM